MTHRRTRICVGAQIECRQSKGLSRHPSQRNRRTLPLARSRAHYLESWSDARAYDGTVSIVQPLIEPLYGGKSAHEVITILAGQSDLARTTLCSSTGKSRAVVPTSMPSGANRCMTAGSQTQRSREKRRGEERQFPGDQSQTDNALSSTSAATPPSTTAASPTTAGCRNCLSR